MSIFISIASYRDLELPKTVNSLMEKADNPDEITLGIISQDVPRSHPKFKNLKNIKYVKMHYSESRGVGFARKKAMELYDGEDYFFQIDSHMRFVEGWDTKLKLMLEKAQDVSGQQKIILSQFPAPYIVGSDGSDIFIKGDKDFWDDVSWTSVTNTPQGAWAGKREEMLDKKFPHKSHTVLAGLLFAPGSFVEEIPYDPRISFMGEELCIAIRAYTRGWEIYAPNEMVAWHFYKREDRPKVWKDLTFEHAWMNIEAESFTAQKGILTGEDRTIFGIGDYDKYVEYQEMIGINFADWYDGQLDKKANLSVIETEIFPGDSMFSITRYCKLNKHSECHSYDLCDCECHSIKKKNSKGR